MSLLYDVVVVLHLLGMAALVGGWMTQVRAGADRTVTATVLYGAATQVVTGLVLVGIASTIGDQAVDNVKMAVKLVLALIVLVLAGANRRRSSVTGGAYGLIGGLAVLNVAIAVLWT